MKKPHKIIQFSAMFLLIALFFLPGAALAQAPWQWQLSLQVRDEGQAMYMPSAVAFDTESGRYYVVDMGRNRLVSFERDGKVLRAFTANDRLKSPFDMVRFDNGQLWVVEKGRNSLTLIDIGAKKVEPNTLRDEGRIVFPDRIAAREGKLHVLDRASGMVLRLDENLAVEKRFGCPDCSGGLADFVLVDDQVLAIDPRGKKIYRFRQDGSIEKEIDLGDEVSFPVSLDVGPSGFIYVLDRHKNSVLTYSQTGQFRYSFLSTGMSPGKLYYPSQIRFDPWERLTIVDEGNGRVEIFGR